MFTWTLSSSLKLNAAQLSFQHTSRIPNVFYLVVQSFIERMKSFYWLNNIINCEETELFLFHARVRAHTNNSSEFNSRTTRM